MQKMHSTRSALKKKKGKKPKIVLPNENSHA